MTDVFGGDPAARAALEDILIAVRRDGSTPERHQAVAHLHTVVKQYEATANVLLLWEAIEILTSPVLSDPPVHIPLVLRQYLNRAAADIRQAARSSKVKPELVAKALGFAGRQGASLGGGNGKQQKMLADLAVYEVLLERHGSTQAEAMMAKTLNITQGGMRDRLSEARAFADKFYRAAGVVIPKGAKPAASVSGQ